jgi:hypothetical protein
VTFPPSPSARDISAVAAFLLAATAGGVNEQRRGAGSRCDENECPVGGRKAEVHPENDNNNNIHWLYFYSFAESWVCPQKDINLAC